MPAVLLVGHYHKQSASRWRDSWIIQSGCHVDLSPWARSKLLHYSIGGVLVRLTQDAESGQITACQTELRTWQTDEYQNNRWQPIDPILPPRSPR